MSLFTKILRSAVSSPVGDGRHSNPVDVVSVRKNLGHLGLDTGDLQHRIIDRKLDLAIRKFQQKKGLRVDGLINPRGETETAMNEALLRLMSDEGGDDGDMPALPPGDVESEPLPPQNIPGTDIPDKGIPEGIEPDQDYLDDRDKWRYEIDPEIEVPYYDRNPEWEA